MNESFGKTWWGEQFLQSLANIDYSNRLPRGKNYARNGAIAKLEIKENHIHARVKGSQVTPYKIDIVIPPFFPEEIDKFIRVLIKQPIILAKLLHRQLDAQILEIAASLGLKVFPKSWTDFKMRCSCPDWAVPCKHLAATIYKVSSEIDNNPFLVFELHRFDIIAELKKLGITYSEKSVAVSNIAELYLEKSNQISSKKLTKNKIAIALEEENAQVNNSGQPKNKSAKSTKDKKTSSANEVKDAAPEQLIYQKLAFTTIPQIHQPLLAILQRQPAFYPGSGDFRDKYQDALNVVVRQASKIINDKMSFASSLIVDNVADIFLNGHSELKLTVNERLEPSILLDDKAANFKQMLLQLHSIASTRLVDYQPSVAILRNLLYLALHLLARGAVVPQIYRQIDKQYAIRWLPALLSKEVSLLVRQISPAYCGDIFTWNVKNSNLVNNNLIVDKNPILNILSLFITYLLAEWSSKSNKAGDRFIKLFFAEGNFAFDQPGEEAIPGGIQAWLQKYYLNDLPFAAQLLVRQENAKSEQFAVDLNIRIFEQDEAKLIALRDFLADDNYQKIRFQVLPSLTQLSDWVTGLDSYINQGGKSSIVMQNQDFAPFILEAVPAIKLLGIEVLLPKSLQNILRPKASIKIKKTGKSAGFLRINDLLAFDPRIALGEHLVSPEEFAALLAKSDGLLHYKAQFFQISSEEIAKLNKYLEFKDRPQSLQLLTAALSEEYNGAKVEITDEVKKLIKQLTNIDELALPGSLKADLRPYQRRGFAWLVRNRQLGFGSVIADDMGLGKTLQVIATLLHFKEQKILTNDNPALVIVPTGLLGNWQAEIKKFAPSLKSHVFHGVKRSLPGAKYDVLLTTYGVLRSSLTDLKKHHWSAVVIDEAQNIKNIETSQSKAVKSLNADHYIAMSGTPVENRLSELWSIVDFANPGLLGSIKNFTSEFALPIQNSNDIAAAERLKKITAPFLLRRLKTDKTIISDLPDKIEINSFATLSKEQTAIYQQTLQEAMNEIEGINTSTAQGLFIRQGIVLQMILALKQICNHPANYLKEPATHFEHSGKVIVLFEKLDAIIAAGEKVLIFTQFTEMGEILKQFIRQRYSEEPLFYHGGCSLKERQNMVDSFQQQRAEKIFILSLKAAGTGLNLTAANHVIHFDLWWNPAVEAQATDRAYRIGQKSNVMVHRLICQNTFEERIDAMIQAKKNLANLTVASGESWIGQLSNTELDQLFKLG